MLLITVIRILLVPFSVLYGLIVTIRNFCFDVGIFKSTSFDLPIITVGNLSVGGTGKTPQIEYLIRLLQDHFFVAVLSRGYKRKSKGFVLAKEKATVMELGDEPYQYHQKFEKIQVAVDADRVSGVQQLLKLKPATEVVLLDDAYQHRKIKAGYQLLLTSYDKLFYNDFMLPTGNLREFWWGKTRANTIVVTKCPANLSVEKQQKIIKSIQPKPFQKVFFTKIGYANKVMGSATLLLKDFKKHPVLLVTGIAKPKPLLEFLTALGVNFEHLEFSDHHHFTEREINTIHEKLVGKKLLTTEKDYVRLQSKISELYYIPITTEFLNQKEKFDKTILKFVQQKA